MQKLRQILKSYKLLLFLSAVISLLSLELVVLNAITENIVKSTTELDRKLRNLRINETERMLQLLDKTAAEYNFPVLQERDARNWLLESLENFRLAYGARVMTPVTNVESSYRVTIDFSFSPNRPEDLVQLINYMKSSVSPIYHIKSMHLNNDQKTRKKISFQVDMIQPYMGGEYVFFRYLALVPINLWLRAMIPAFMLVVVFFLSGFVAEQIDQLFQKRARKTQDIFKVQLGGDNAAFASALSKEKEIIYINPGDYSDIIKGEHIQRQRNNLVVYKTPENNSNTTVAGSIERAVRPVEPVYTVSSIFVGKIRQFAVINDKVAKVGDRIGNDEKIVEIKEGKVRVSGPWGERWLFVNY